MVFAYHIPSLVSKVIRVIVYVNNYVSMHCMEGASYMWIYIVKII